ncbi:MAG: ATP-binding cassette domain-containing protein [Actinobacteria bacterium]|nr:ATP-binding cassette domain-containing protein [Actinomycetota bacterium]
MMKNVISLTSVDFSYQDKPDVLKNISFDVSGGKSVGIIGPNGAGKTTLFLLLCGILKPTAGRIRIMGEDVLYKGFNPAVGYIFQNPDDQLFSPTVRDDVAFGPINMALSQQEIDARIEKALNISGCKELAQRPSHHLSGGEKRMVAIASVLAMEPKIVIYDEPTASLDMRARRKVINLIKSERKTNLVASHDMEFILETCQRVIIINSGKIVARGEAALIMRDKELMENSGLEVPYSLRG